jgi:hypothetical protein
MPEQPSRDAILALRDRAAAFHVASCGMAHERIPSGADGMPLRDSRNQSGYGRPGICAEAQRVGHLGCSHTMARHALRDVIEQAGGDATEAMLDELQQLEGAISLLDHRRYDAECGRAAALLSGAHKDIAEAQAEIVRLVAEHRAYGQRALRLRDEVLRRLEAALSC